jgi:hypothetical protein
LAVARWKSAHTRASRTVFYGWNPVETIYPFSVRNWRKATKESIRQKHATWIHQAVEHGASGLSNPHDELVG